MTKFKRIGIFGRVRNSGVNETLQSLIKFLRSLKLEIFIETETASSLETTDIPIIPRDQLGEYCDLLIVVGGDGSLLHAAHAAVNLDLPVLGINRGSLGFLTDILPTQLDKIGEILQGKYILEERFLLTAITELHGEELVHDDA